MATYPVNLSLGLLFQASHSLGLPLSVYAINGDSVSAWPRRVPMVELGGDILVYQDGTVLYDDLNDVDNLLPEGEVRVIEGAFSYSLGDGTYVSNSRQVTLTFRGIASSVTPILPKITDIQSVTPSGSTFSVEIEVDSGSGELYWIATSNATAASPQDILNGVNASGSAVPAGTQAVTSNGSQTLTGDGLPATSSIRYLQVVHRLANGLLSNTIISSGFLTSAATITYTTGPSLVPLTEGDSVVSARRGTVGATASNGEAVTITTVWTRNSTSGVSAGVAAGFNEVWSFVDQLRAPGATPVDLPSNSIAVSAEVPVITVSTAPRLVVVTDGETPGDAFTSGVATSSTGSAVTETVVFTAGGVSVDATDPLVFEEILRAEVTYRTPGADDVVINLGPIGVASSDTGGSTGPIPLQESMVRDLNINSSIGRTSTAALKVPGVATTETGMSIDNGKNLVTFSGNNTFTDWDLSDWVVDVQSNAKVRQCIIGPGSGSSAGRSGIIEIPADSSDWEISNCDIRGTGKFSGLNGFTQKWSGSGNSPNQTSGTGGLFRYNDMQKIPADGMKTTGGLIAEWNNFGPAQNFDIGTEDYSPTETYAVGDDVLSGGRVYLFTILALPQAGEAPPTEKRSYVRGASNGETIARSSYSSTVTYPLGELVVSGSGNTASSYTVYRSLIANNRGNNLSDTASWFRETGATVVFQNRDPHGDFLNAYLVINPTIFRFNRISRDVTNAVGVNNSLRLFRNNNNLGLYGSLTVIGNWMEDTSDPRRGAVPSELENRSTNLTGPYVFAHNWFGVNAGGQSLTSNFNNIPASVPKTWWNNRYSSNGNLHPIPTGWSATEVEVPLVVPPGVSTGSTDTSTNPDLGTGASATSIAVRNFSRDYLIYDMNYANGGREFAVPVVGASGATQSGVVVQAQAVREDGSPVTPYQDVDTAAANGSYRGTLTVPRGNGWTRLRVRAKASPSVTSTTSRRFGVGHIIAENAQSEKHQMMPETNHDGIVPHEAVIGDRVEMMWIKRPPSVVAVERYRVTNTAPVSGAMKAFANTWMEATDDPVLFVWDVEQGTSWPDQMDEGGQRQYSASITLRDSALTDEGQAFGAFGLGWHASPSSLGSRYKDGIIALTTKLNAAGNPVSTPYTTPDGLTLQNTYIDLWGQGSRERVRAILYGPHRYDRRPDVPSATNGVFQNAIVARDGTEPAYFKTKQAVREDDRVVVANDNLRDANGRRIILAEGNFLEPLNYSNGEPGGGTFWGDITHPSDHQDYGLNQLARLTAHAYLRGLGLTNWREVKLERFYRPTSGAYIEMWSRSGPVTTERKSRGLAEPTAPANNATYTYDHWTEVLGFEIDGVPANRVEVRNGRIRIYPNSGSFAPGDESRIIYGRGGATGTLNSAADLDNELYFNIPVVDVGASRIAGVALRPLIMPTVAGVAYSSDADNEYTSVGTTGGTTGGGSGGGSTGAPADIEGDPVIVSRSIALDAVDVPINAQPTVTFSEYVTIQNGILKIRDPANTANIFFQDEDETFLSYVGGTTSSETLRLILPGNLPANQRVEVVAATSLIQDLGNNSIPASEKVLFRFTTAAAASSGGTPWTASYDSTGVQLSESQPIPYTYDNTGVSQS